MVYLKIWLSNGLFNVAEIDQPTNVCSPEFVYPVSSYYHGEWNTSYHTKNQICEIRGTVIHYAGESTYEDFEKEFLSIMVGDVPIKNFKSSVIKNRLESYGMYYSVSDHIKIKNTAQLEDSGMETNEALMLQEYSNKSMEVLRVDTEDQVYVVDGTITTFCDSDVFEIVHPSGEW
jgi:hypothetical protein